MHTSPNYTDQNSFSVVGSVRVGCVCYNEYKNRGDELQAIPGSLREVRFTTCYIYTYKGGRMNRRRTVLNISVAQCRRATEI